jgi:hypothetical protein
VAYVSEGLVKIESQSSGPGDKLNNEDGCKGSGKMCAPSQLKEHTQVPRYQI